jgi:hypothetical protein
LLFPPKGIQVLKKRVLLLVNMRRIQYDMWLTISVTFALKAIICMREIQPAFVFDLGRSDQVNSLKMLSNSRTPCFLKLKQDDIIHTLAATMLDAIDYFNWPFTSFFKFN